MQRLKLLLAIQGIKQIKLKDKTGIDLAKINKCINHPQSFKFTSPEKSKIATALNVQESWLFDEAGKTLVLEEIPFLDKKVLCK